MIATPTCPICGTTVPPASFPGASQSAPFCSKRCQQVDLFRWFDGKYVIAEPLDPERHLEDLAELQDPGEEYPVE